MRIAPKRHDEADRGKKKKKKKRKKSNRTCKINESPLRWPIYMVGM